MAAGHSRIRNLLNEMHIYLTISGLVFLSGNTDTIFIFCGNDMETLACY